MHLVRLKREHDHGRGVTLGGRLRVRKGEKPTLDITVTSACRPHPQGILPELAHVDLVRGAVRGPAADRDGRRAPDTKVAWSKDVSRRKGTYALRVPLTAGEESFYVRLRGSDGNGTEPVTSVPPSTRTNRSQHAGRRRPVGRHLV